MNEAFKLGDRVAVMKDGEIVQIGTPEEILENPSNAYIEDFVQDIDRTKVVQAKDVMKKPNAVVSLKDGIKVAIKEMEYNSISSVFVTGKDRTIQGIVTIDDCIRAAKENKSSLKDILRHDYYTTKGDTYIQDLIEKATKTKYPIVVTDDEQKMIGIIVRTSILSGLLQKGA